MEEINRSSLKTIAQELNLSISTVSRVVNGTGKISVATRKKVMKALEKHQYVPNQIARSLKTNETKTVGVIVPDIADYFATVIKGVDAVLASKEYSIILVDTNEQPEKEHHYMRLLYEKRIDGLLLATVDPEENKWITEYKNKNIPIVFFDNEPVTSEKCDAVMLDNLKASAMVVNHLAEMGHKNIAIICGERSESTAKERSDGFRIAMKNKRLPVDLALIKEGSFHLESGYQSMVELLNNRKEHPFTAVYATSYKMTCGAIKAIREYNLRYPDDIALVGFDFLDEYGLHEPSITSIIQPVRNIGCVLAARLLESMQNSKKHMEEDVYSVTQTIRLPPELKIGASSSKQI